MSIICEDSPLKNKVSTTFTEKKFKHESFRDFLIAPKNPSEHILMQSLSTYFLLNLGRIHTNW